MKITKEFSGIVGMDGDDGYCYGIHFVFKGCGNTDEIDKLHPHHPENPNRVKKGDYYSDDYYRVKKEYDAAIKIKEDSERAVINYLDKISEEYSGKNVKITITTEVDE